MYLSVSTGIVLLNNEILMYAVFEGFSKTLYSFIFT